MVDLQKIGLNPKRKYNLSLVQQKVIQVLVRAIRDNLTNKINYDHIDLEVPRYPITLNFKGFRNDISFIYKNRIVFISVQTLPLKEAWRKEGEENGKS